MDGGMLQLSCRGNSIRKPNIKIYERKCMEAPRSHIKQGYKRLGKLTHEMRKQATIIFSRQQSLLVAAHMGTWPIIRCARICAFPFPVGATPKTSLEFLFSCSFASAIVMLFLGQHLFMFPEHGGNVGISGQELIGYQS